LTPRWNFLPKSAGYFSKKIRLTQLSEPRSRGSFRNTIRPAPFSLRLCSAISP
jgi:hypothetical protein